MSEQSDKQEYVSRDTVRILEKLVEVDTRLELIIKRIDEKLGEHSKRLDEINRRVDELERIKDESAGKLSIISALVATAVSGASALAVRFFS